MIQTRRERQLKIIQAKKAYELFKTSWSVQTKLFFENCTLHGVKYIAERGRPLYERIMWFMCVAVGAVSAMIIIVSLWEKFQTNPTITGLDTDFHNWDVAFPAVTLCSSAPIDVEAISNYTRENNIPEEKTESLTNFIVNLAGMSYGSLELSNDDFYQAGFVPEGTNLKEFVFQFMNPCKNIFSDCFWKSDPYACCSGFFPIFTEIGFCYTFNSRHYEKRSPGIEQALPAFERKYIKETDIKWSFKFDITTGENVSGIPIFIHNSDELPGLDIEAQHVWEGNVDRISFSVKETYTTEDTRQLSMKQRHCIFEDEVHLHVDHIYTYTACTRECRMRTSKKICGCVPHFYLETTEFKHCSLTELKCVRDNLQAIKSVDKCTCMLGCSNTVYEVEKFNENPESKGLETEFVSWPMVRYKREVLFGWVDLLVSFGGIAGLFLGFSLLSAVEIIYYFTIRTCCMIKMEKNELKKMQRDKVLKKKKSEYDMSLVPSFMDKRRKHELFRRNINIFNNKKIAPFQDQQKNATEFIVSPFGIEYLN